MGLWTLESKVHLRRSFLERKRGHEHLNSFTSNSLRLHVARPREKPPRRGLDGLIVKW